MDTNSTMGLEELMKRLEQETRLAFNMSASQYLASLQTISQNNNISLDTDAGIAWVIVLPIIYFGSVSIVLLLLLTFFHNSPSHPPTEVTTTVSTQHEEGSARSAVVIVTNASLESKSISPNHGTTHHEIVTPVPTAATTTSIAANFIKKSGFTRGFINAAGYLEGGEARASGTSKGSVRSLGVLTEFDKGRVRRFPGLTLHPPPSAPTVFAKREAPLQRLVGQHRLSKSIDELREGPSSILRSAPEWSLLKANAEGRTSLEVNITTGSSERRLSLIDSIIVDNDLPKYSGVGVKIHDLRPKSISLDSLENNQDIWHGDTRLLSQDSLRTSMDLQKDDIEPSGLRSDELYENATSLRDAEFTNGKDIEHGIMKNDRRQSNSPIPSSPDSLDNANGIDKREKAAHLIRNHLGDTSNSSNSYSEIYSNRNTKIVVPMHNYFLQSERYCFDNPLFKDLSKSTDIQQKRGNEHLHITAKNEIFSKSQPETANAGCNTRSNKRPRLERQDASKQTSNQRPTNTENGFRLERVDFITSKEQNTDQIDYKSTRMAKRPVGRQLFASVPQKSESHAPEPASWSIPVRSGRHPRAHNDTSRRVEVLDVRGYHGASRGFACLPDNESSSHSLSLEMSDFPKMNNYCELSMLKTSATRINKDQNPNSLQHIYQDGSTDFKPQQTHNNEQQDSLYNQVIIPIGSESPSQERQDTDISTVSGMSPTVSVWTSSAASEPLHEPGSGSLDEAVDSADSTVDSLSSSIAPFHAKRQDSQPQSANYPFPGDLHGVIRQSEVSAKAHLSPEPDPCFSIDANMGSRDQSLLELGDGLLNNIEIPNGVRSDDTDSHKNMYGSDFESKKGKDDLDHQGTLFNLAQKIFSNKNHNLITPLWQEDNATHSGILNTPDVRKNTEERKIRAKEVPVISNEKITVQQRLSEFGFIKAEAGSATFVVNPSPSKFSKRNNEGPDFVSDDKKFTQYDAGVISRLDETNRSGFLSTPTERDGERIGEENPFFSINEVNNNIEDSKLHYTGSKENLIETDRNNNSFSHDVLRFCEVSNGELTMSDLS